MWGRGASVGGHYWLGHLGQDINGKVLGGRRGRRTKREVVG